MELSEDDTDNQNKNARLGHEWVQVLINLRMKYARSFTGKRHSAASAWNDIMHEMRELGAPKTINRLRIKKKWMNLTAKYKQLKGEPDAAKQNAWPYFEQIDRAYSKKLVDGAKPLSDFTDNPVLCGDDTKKHVEKEKFMRKLIDLRYQFCHMFTGKKYAAQKGWMIIQNYLPSGDKYTIEQISKVWHNLIQRYKTVIDNEPDHGKITWTYFHQLHEIMSKRTEAGEAPSSIEFVDQVKSAGLDALPADGLNLNPFQDVPEVESEEKVVPFLKDEVDGCFDEQEEIHGLSRQTSDVGSFTLVGEVQKRTSSTSLDDILDYLQERDRKRDEQMKQIFDTLQEILLKLKE